MVGEGRGTVQGKGRVWWGEGGRGGGNLSDKEEIAHVFCTHDYVLNTIA